MGFGDDPGFAMQNEPEDTDAGWAAGFDDDNTNDSSHDLNFAKSEMKEVLNTSTPGSKQKKSGLGASAAINYSNELNEL